MSIAVRSLLAANGEAQIAAAYNEAGYRYARYADGAGRNLFCFEGRHAYGDRKSWETIEARLQALRARGLTRLRVVDWGCGPGTWLRRVVARAHRIGFTAIEARGMDIADTQLQRARILARALNELPGVEIGFHHGDLRDGTPVPEADLCLCLYGVLNHIPVPDLPRTLSRLSEITAGWFVATVRTVGSQPTVYVDDVSAAAHFFQDNLANRLNIEFANGRRASFQSHLFSRAELVRLTEGKFEVEEMRGLDLFHARFAKDPRWNPPHADPLGCFSQELARLEDRYCCDPGFMDHAAHLLLVARKHGRP